MESCSRAYVRETLATAQRGAQLAQSFRAGDLPACRQYHRFLEELEFRLEAAFDDVRFLMLKEPSVPACVSCWESFVSLCDEVLTALADLRTNIPSCGRPDDFDFLLDLRTEAQERADFLRPV